MPARPSWLLESLSDQFAALLPPRPAYDPAHPLGCHKLRIADRIIFEKPRMVVRSALARSACCLSTCRDGSSGEYAAKFRSVGVLPQVKRI